jgi:hypothetical protein
VALKDKLPNRALSGPELKAIALKEFESMLDRDYAFSGSVAYKRITFAIQATFHLGFPHAPHILQSRAVQTEDGIVEGAPPLNPPAEEATVVGLERTVELENPNLDRINHGLPITIQRATPPKAIIPDSQLPGEPPAAVINAPGVETLEFKYDPEGLPPVKPAVDRDISAEKAAELGVSQTTGGLGLRKKGDVTDEHGEN